MKRKIKKKKLLSTLAIVIFTVALLLLGIFVPKIWSSYEEKPVDNNKENKQEIDNIIEYPLEIKMTEQDTKYFTQFFNDYSVGITAENINLIDLGDVSISTKYFDFFYLKKSMVRNKKMDQWKKLLKGYGIDELDETAMKWIEIVDKALF